MPATRPHTLQTKRLLTDREAADRLGVSRSYIRGLVANGKLRRVELPAIDDDQPARLLRIAESDIDQLIAAGRRSA